TGRATGPRLRAVARDLPAVHHQRPRERTHPAAGAPAPLVPRRPSVRRRPLPDAARLGRRRRAGVRPRRGTTRHRRSVRARRTAGADIRGVLAHHRPSHGALPPPGSCPARPGAGRGRDIRCARLGSSRDERPGADARRRQCHAGECHRERVWDTTCDVRGRAEAVSVSTKKTKPGADSSPGWRSGEVAVTLRPRPTSSHCCTGSTPEGFVPYPPTYTHTPPQGLHPHQRFTLPTRETVTTALRTPRRRVTRVFERPHASPVGRNTMSAFETSSVTPRSAGPAQRVYGCQAPDSRRSMRSESSAISRRARVLPNTAALRVTARAVATSTAVRSTATQSSSSLQRGRTSAVIIPRMASATASSA